jgi:hypothetical protein
MAAPKRQLLVFVLDAQKTKIEKKRSSWQRGPSEYLSLDIKAVFEDTFAEPHSPVTVPLNICSYTTSPTLLLHFEKKTNITNH